VRLRGLLTKSAGQAGFFDAPATRLAVALPSRQPLGGLSEPLGPSARPAPFGCAGNVPNRTRTVPTLADVLKPAWGPGGMLYVPLRDARHPEAGWLSSRAWTEPRPIGCSRRSASSSSS